MRPFLAIAALLALLVPASGQTRNQVDVTALMMPGPLGDMTLGDPNAPVTVIEYASMTCPHCQRFHAETYPTLKAKYIDTGKVYFVLREFPLDPLAFAAIMTARCSGNEHFFDVVDTLFDHQEEWAFVREPVDALISFVQPYGIGPTEFDDCIANLDIFEHVDFVASRGADTFGVEGTPTFFFNGRKAVGELSVGDLDKILSPLLGGDAATAPPLPDAGGAFTPRL
jgi:protein-disulfide isomerase